MAIFPIIVIVIIVIIIIAQPLDFDWKNKIYPAPVHPLAFMKLANVASLLCWLDMKSVLNQFILILVQI